MEISVNSTVILRGGTGIARGALLGVSARLLALLLGSLLVNLLADGVESLLQVVLLCLDGLNIGTLQGFLQGVQLSFALALLGLSKPCQSEPYSIKRTQHRKSI